MDENLRSTTSKATAVYILLLSVILFIGGITVLFTYPLEIWFLGLILIPLSVYLFFSGKRWFKNMKREQLISQAEQNTIRQLIQTNQTTAPLSLTGEAAGMQHPLGAAALQVVILASWTYTPEQWKQFIRWEKKERKSEHIIIMLLVLVIGTFLLRTGRDAPWWAAVAVSAVVALLYGAIGYSVSLHAIKTSGKAITVVITKDAVQVNNQYNRLNGENLWLESVELKNNGSFNYLEFTTGRNTRGGHVKDELRIPVPYGKEVEANALLQAFFVNRK